MNWFGFDFNGDGDVSFAEHMVTMDMMGLFDGEENRSASDDNFDEDMNED